MANGSKSTRKTSNPNPEKAARVSSTASPATPELRGSADDSKDAEIAALRAQVSNMEQQLTSRGSVSDVQVNLNIDPKMLRQLKGRDIETFRNFIRDGNFPEGAHVKYIEDACALLIERYLRVHWTAKLEAIFGEKLVPQSVEKYQASNWRRWPVADLLGPHEAIKAVVLNYETNDVLQEQSTLTEIEQALSVFSDAERNDPTKMRVFLDTLKSKVKKLETAVGSKHTLFYYYSTLTPPTTVAEFCDNFAVACARTREFELLMVVLSAAYTNKKKQPKGEGLLCRLWREGPWF
jgi:hypothetical protein